MLTEMNRRSDLSLVVERRDEIELLCVKLELRHIRAVGVDIGILFGRLGGPCTYPLARYLSQYNNLEVS